jgi:hypothetical protein
MWYWSIEIEAGSYLWEPKGLDPSEIRRKANPFVFPSRKVKQTFVLLHNPLHEFESIWWVLLMVFVMRKVKNSSDDWNQKAQEVQLYRAFPPSLFGNNRVVLLQNNRFMGDLLCTLDTSLSAFGEIMGPLAEMLGQAFCQAERNLPEIDESTWELNGIFYDYWTAGFNELLRRSWPPMVKWADGIDEDGEGKRGKKRPFGGDD